MSNRLSVTKTPKCYVGGAFIRSESGRTYPINDNERNFFGHIPQCTRKDLRNAVEAAAKSGAGWAKRTGYNRGQILYRIAEMLEARHSELTEAVALGGGSKQAATVEVSATIDRAIYYAGWTDKVEQLLGNVNPVAAPFFNFTVTEPMGIIGLLAPEDAPLLGLMSLVLPCIAGGNSVVALASSSRPYPSILLGEILAASDLPGGVVNVLTGFRKEIVPTFATHAHLRGVGGVADAEERKTLRLLAADSVKRTHLIPAEESIDWASPGCQSLEWIAKFLEFKTTWHPIGS